MNPGPDILLSNGCSTCLETNAFQSCSHNDPQAWRSIGRDHQCRSSLCRRASSGLTISADRDVVSVRIPERELHCLSVRIQLRFLFESVDESACPVQGLIIVVDAKEQEEPIARRRLVRTHQGRMLVRAPLMETQQHGSIRIQDLAKVVMDRRRLGLAEERLVPFEADRNATYADDGPRAFHRISAGGLTRIEQISLIKPWTLVYAVSASLFF